MLTLLSPAPCVSPHALPCRATEPPGRLGLPGSLAPPRCEVGRGGRGGAGAPTAASAPCAVLQPVGTEVYSPGAGTIPNPPPKPAAGVPESPSHPAAVETSLTPRRGAGTVGVGSGRVWKPVSEKGGDTGVLFEQGKAPLVPDLTTQSPPKMPTYTESGGLFLPGRKVAPSQAPRSLPSQGLRGPAFQSSGLPLCFSQDDFERVAEMESVCPRRKCVYD
nr:formin-2-like [Globicephala melas]